MHLCMKFIMYNVRCCAPMYEVHDLQCGVLCNVECCAIIKSMYEGHDVQCGVLCNFNASF